MSLPVARKLAPSTDPAEGAQFQLICKERLSNCSAHALQMRSLPVVEKAQQEPQKAWFFTGVTAPFSTQLMLSAASTFS